MFIETVVMLKCDAWMDLRQEDVALIVAEKSKSARRRRIASTLDLDASTTSGMASTCLYDHAFRFSFKEGYRNDQIARLITIVKRVHEKAIGDVDTIEASFRHFSELLCKSGVQRPPFSIGVWSSKQLRGIAEWFTSEYYDHYTLYQGICRPPMVMNLSVSDVSDVVEGLPELQPLRDSISEEEHLRIIEHEREEQMKREAARRAVELEENLQQCLALLPTETKTTIEVYIENRILSRETGRKQGKERDPACGHTPDNNC